VTQRRLGYGGTAVELASAPTGTTASTIRAGSERLPERATTLASDSNRITGEPRSTATSVIPSGIRCRRTRTPWSTKKRTTTTRTSTIATDYDPHAFITSVRAANGAHTTRYYWRWTDGNAPPGPKEFR